MCCKLMGPNSLQRAMLQFMLSHDRDLYGRFVRKRYYLYQLVCWLPGIAMTAALYKKIGTVNEGRLYRVTREETSNLEI